MQTEQARPSPFVEPLKALPLVLVSLVVVIGAVDLLLLWQPGILLALRGDWQNAVPNGTSGSTLLAAVVIIAAIAISATILTGFVRGVRAAPYLCLAPLWVGLCMLVIGRMQVVLPIPLPTPAFVSICALLFVGSGVLFESRSSTSSAVGAVLSALPILVLGLGYALTPVRFDTSAVLVLIVLTLAAAGAPVIAIACRANGTKLVGGHGVSREDLNEQVATLLEHARSSEERAVRAERQLLAQPAYAQPSAAPRIAADDEELAMLREPSGAGKGGWILATLLSVLTLGGYFFGITPLRAELEKTRSESEALTARHGEELTALRAKAESDRKALEAQMSAAATAEPPPINPSGPSAKAAAALAATPSHDATPSPSVKLPARVEEDEDDDESADDALLDAERQAQAEARRAARAARQEQLKAEREAATAQADADAAERAQAAEERKAARAAKREQAAADRDARAAERAAVRETRAAEREAKREARLAARAEGADDEEEEDEEAPPEPKRAEPPPVPTPAPKDSIDSSNDDPLEGLDGL